MGPRPYGRGNAVRVHKGCAVLVRFNGAATVRPRKSGSRCPERIQTVRASMGPRPYGRGNTFKNRWMTRKPVCFNGAATVRPRKCRSLPAVPAQTFSLQWGRDRTAAEMATISASSPFATWLQWGRDRTAAEMLALTAPTAAASAASMGPRPYGRGNKRKPRSRFSTG